MNILQNMDSPDLDLDDGYLIRSQLLNLYDLPELDLEGG